MECSSERLRLRNALKVEASYLAQYEPHDVGGSAHSEYWIPAEQLDEFNNHIVGLIEVIARFP